MYADGEGGLTWVYLSKFIAGCLPAFCILWYVERAGERMQRVADGSMQLVGLRAPLSASNFVESQRSKLDQSMDKRQICNKIRIVHFGMWAGQCSLSKSLNFALCLNILS